MRVLHLNHAKAWHGGERQTLLLAAALHERGIASPVACRADSPLARHAREQGVPVIPLPANPLSATLKLAQAARQFELVHCHTARAHSLAALTAFLHCRPVIATRRVDVRPKRHWFNRYKYARAAKVVCISGVIARQLQEWGVPPEKLDQVYSAVPLPPAVPPEERAKLRAELGLAADRKLVGNIANLVPHKDHPTLLRAAREVAARRADVTFVVLGGGPLRESLLALRGELGLEERVFMPGYVPRAERFLPAFDVFAMSSSTEGLGSIVLDAFAAGVPVASTAGGGLPELVRDGDTGLLAPVGDAVALGRAMLRLLEDAALADALRARARQWVAANFSVQSMAEGYLRIYREVLGDR